MLSKREVFDVICSNCFGDLFFMNFYHSLGLFSRQQTDTNFLIFFSPAGEICMKYQILFSEKNTYNNNNNSNSNNNNIIKENYFNMSSAEIFAQTV